MTAMKKSFFTLLVCFSLFYKVSVAQKIAPFNLYNTNQVEIIGRDGNSLKNPFCGGMNTPLFNAIDVNLDGLNDLICMDLSDTVLTVYLQQQDKTFKYAPDYSYVFPSLNHYMFLRDYNNDGKPDIFAYGNGSLICYKNTSTASKVNFKLISNEIDWRFQKYFGYGGAVYSAPNLLPILRDLDNDGDLDIISSGVFAGTLSYYRCYNKDTFGTDYARYDSLKYDFMDESWGCVQIIGNSSIRPDSFYHIPGLGLCQTYRRYFKKHQGAQSDVFDVDDDGDYDLLFSDINGSRITVVINGKAQISSTKAPYIRDTFIKTDTTYFKESIPFVPLAHALDVDGDGLEDIVAASTDGQNFAGKDRVFYYHNEGKSAKTKFKLMNRSFINDQMLDEGFKSAPAFYDENKDGIPEWMVISTKGHYGNSGSPERLVRFKNIGTGSQVKFKFSDDDWLGLLKLKMYDLNPTFGDLDNDGKIDLVLGHYDTANYSPKAPILFYKNKSTTSLESFVSTKIPGFDTLFSTIYGAVPCVVDFNKDGKSDLVIGDGQGYLHYFEYAKYIVIGGKVYPELKLKNDSLGNFQLYVPGSGNFLCPTFYDINRNGKLDCLIGSQDGHIIIYYDIEGNTTGTWTQSFNNIHNFTFKQDLEVKLGNNIFPAIANLDGDTFPDIIVGSDKGGLFFLRNNLGPTAIQESKIVADPLLKLYPNPTNQILNVDLPNQNRIKSLWITDVSGKKLDLGYELKDNSVKINTEPLPKGMYLITVINSNNQSFNAKFMK